jgi:hypothetical protein
LIYDGNTVLGTELKCRKWKDLQIAINTDSLYIEPDKFGECIDYFVTHTYYPEESIFDAWKHLYIHVLPTIPKDKIMDIGNVWCRNSNRYEHKYGLPMSMAYHYEYNVATNLMELKEQPQGLLE